MSFIVVVGVKCEKLCTKNNMGFRASLSRVDEDLRG